MRKVNLEKRTNFKNIFSYLLASFGVLVFVNALATVGANACATMMGEYDIPEAALRD